MFSLSRRSALLAVLLPAIVFAGGIAKVPQGTETPEALKAVGIDQRLDSQIPLDAAFRNQRGETVTIGSLLRRRPAILTLVYYECPMLCTMILNGTLRTIRALEMTAGRDYDIITLSFDPSETPEIARRKREEYLERYHRPEAEQGWHFLVGEEANIRKVAEAAGFRYQRDPGTNQWAHASAIMVLTPEGRLSRYFYGVEYSARDLRLGLVEAAAGKIGTAVDQILLYCFHYDPATGKYSLAVLNTLRGAAALTVLALAGFWFKQYRNNRKRHHHVELPTIS